MLLTWLLDRFEDHGQNEAVMWRDQTTTYAQLRDWVDAAGIFLSEYDVRRGEVVILDADFSPRAIALLLAAMANGNIVVPVASHVVADRDNFARIAQASRHLTVDKNDAYTMRQYEHEISHELLVQIRDSDTGGIVFFSSGSTGQPKAAVHDLERLVGKFKVERHTQRLITFMLFDHIGGFNTMMYGLANTGCLITLETRDVMSVCRAIEQHRAEVLPASPTFLNLLIVSQAHKDFDLSSLKIINYATEVMPEATLAKLNEIFPAVHFRQSYGLSELGIMRSQSRSDDSVWVKVGGEDYQTRIVDGMLHIKAKSSMLGYLNAPSPFDEDGWFNTYDQVDVDGQWLRFKGRESDIINVGGEKVYPAEVENVILEVDNIADATVTKQVHPLTGHIVVAQVRLNSEEDMKSVTKRIRRHCSSKLPSYKVPVKVMLATGDRMSARFKKTRRDNTADS